MTTYSDLLLSENWRERRKEILLRDKSTCTNCSNQELLFNSHIAKVLWTKKVNKGSFIDFKNPLSETEGNIFIAEEQCKNIKRGQLILISAIHISINNFISKPRIIGKHNPNNEVIDFLVDIWDLNPINEEDLFKIMTLFNHKKSLLNSNWKIFGGLEIHHKYYQKGLLPWEYPDEALTTLCYNCHSNLHSNTKVPYYDVDGSLLQYYTPCKRCCGVGRFEEYRDVNHGI